MRSKAHATLVDWPNCSHRLESPGHIAGEVPDKEMFISPNHPTVLRWFAVSE
jgi:hypothetical protein